MFDRELTIVAANAAYLAATRSSREAILGRKLFDAFPSDPDSAGGRLVRQSLDRVLTEGTPDHLALVPYAIPDGSGGVAMRYWSATHTPLRGPTGEVALVVQHTADVTDLIRAREGASSTALMNGEGVFRRAQALQASNTALAQERQQMRRLFDEAPGFTAVLRGPEHVFELANGALTELLGRDVNGMTLADAVPEVAGQGFIELLEEVERTAKPYVGRAATVMLRPGPGLDPTERVLDFVFQPILDGEDRVEGVFVQGHDITEQKRTERRLARQTELLRLAQEAAGIGTFDYDVTLGHIWGSKTFAALFGLEPNADGWPIDRVVEKVVPEDRHKVMTSRERPLAELVTRTEYRVMGEGGLRWLARQGEIRQDEAGRPVQVLGAVYDISDRKAAEAQLRLLMGEAAHRIKNLLAMVQAIVTQTLRNAAGIEEAQAALTARLAALAHAQDTLVLGSHASADIRTVVEASTRLLSDLPGRFRIEGEPATLEPNAVLGLALLLHELGTNALKYGALSVPEGQVEVRWEVERGADALRLTWIEKDGPVVALPHRKGFGSRLIERGLGTYLGGEVNLEYRPAGLVCRATVSIGEGSGG